MLDPCSTGSYVTEAAAEELQLNGEVHDLTISGTGGSRVKKQSKQVSLVVTSLNRNFSENLRATIGEEHRRKSRSHFTRALTIQAKLSSQQFSDTTTNLDISGSLKLSASRTLMTGPWTKKKRLPK